MPVPTPTVASAPPSPPISFVDFIVDGRGYVGKRITISQCSVRDAADTWARCSSAAGNIHIESSSMERESRRYALQYCADYHVKPECMGDITGIVTWDDVLGLMVTNATANASRTR
jgi:hypothetical protein